MLHRRGFTNQSFFEHFENVTANEIVLSTSGGDVVRRFVPGGTSIIIGNTTPQMVRDRTTCVDFLTTRSSSQPENDFSIVRYRRWAADPSCRSRR
jgi:hypothetical protein